MGISLSRADARRVALWHQGLLRSTPFGRGAAGAREAISHIGYVQIDTVSVAARAHDHVLWSRVRGASQRQFDTLLKRREIFEYWAHAAAYLPMEDYRYSLFRKRRIQQGEERWATAPAKLRKDVLARIARDGPLGSADFEDTRDDKDGVWGWDWKPAKRALEHLFMRGELMVSARRGFNKVYDLTENVLPDHIDRSEPTPEEYGEYLIRRHLRAHGIGTRTEFGYARRGVGPCVAEALPGLVESGEVEEITVRRRGSPDLSLYGDPRHIEAALSGRAGPRRVHLLNPFDNLVIQRKRLQALFDFDYTIEIYVKPEDRRYGYYALPILDGTELIGRVDVKADRQADVLRLRNLTLEPHVKVDDARVARIAREVSDYMQLNACSELVIERSDPGPLGSALAAEVAKGLISQRRPGDSARRR